MLKKEFTQLIKNIKKTKKSFALGVFNDIGFKSDFVLYNKEINMTAFSSKTTDEIKLKAIVGPDDIEYINDAMKQANKDDDIFFRIDEDSFSVATVERVFYSSRLRNINLDFSFNYHKKSIELNSAKLKDSFKLISSFVDLKGAKEIPYFYIRKDSSIYAYSFSAWVFSLFNIVNLEKEKTKVTFRYNVDDISNSLSLFPSGKTVTVSFSLGFDGELTFSFQNCELTVKGIKNDNHEFIKNFQSVKYDNKIEIDAAKTKSMLDLMKGAFSGNVKDFVSIEKDSENFAKIENCPTNEDSEVFSFKIPIVKDEGYNKPINLYGKYLKDVVAKVNGESIVINSNDDVVKISSKDDSLFVISMTKRKEDIVLQNNK